MKNAIFFFLNSFPDITHCFTHNKEQILLHETECNNFLTLNLISRSY